MPGPDSHSLYGKTRDQSNVSDETVDTTMIDDDEDVDFEADVPIDEEAGSEPEQPALEEEEEEYEIEVEEDDGDAGDDGDDGDGGDDAEDDDSAGAAEEVEGGGAAEDDDNDADNEEDDDDDDDDYDEDEPLEAQLKNQPSLGGGDEALVNGHVDVAGSVGGHDDEGDDDEDDEDDDDDDDDVPLSARVPTGNARVPKPPSPAHLSGATSESGDDLPLAERQRAIHEAMRKKDGRKRRAPAQGPKTAEKKRRSAGKSGGRSSSKAVKTSRSALAKRTRKEKEDVPTRKFEKPGQRRETPPETDPARLFYQSLYAQKLALGKPSPMAETWMLRHGLLEEDVATKVLSRLKAEK